jgi:hypothetical protein
MGSGGSTRTLIIAGSALALDIDFANNVVKKVSLSFPESPEIVSRHTDKAGDILLRDLEFAPGESALTKMLDRFAANLERLAALDKLSVVPGLNCHEAIAGIYESLERLHKWEVARLKEHDYMARKGEEYVELAAMCRKSGKPVMHTRNRLGMSLDYWQAKRRIQAKGPPPTIWSLLIECAPIPLSLEPAHAYTSLRVSEKWISLDIKKVDPAPEDLLMADGPVLDWLEPENTLIPSTDQGGMEGIGQPNQKLPDVMFIAKFDPPLIVPYGLAMQTGANVEPYQMSTFDGLIFPPRANEKIEPGETRKITQNKAVPVVEAGVPSIRIHHNELFIQKADYGRVLTELPFDHPRKLVEILPALRQYAFLSTILRKSFNADPSPPAVADDKKASGKSNKDKYQAFMAEAPAEMEARGKNLKVDVSFTTHPFPKIDLVFPFRKKVARISFKVLLNGVVEVESQNVLEKEHEKRIGERELAEMLEVTEDLGIWVEFIMRRLG